MMIQTQDEVSVQVVTLNNQVVTVSDETGFRFAVAAVDESGEPMQIAADGSLVVRRDNWINIAGNGLQPNSTAVAWVFSEPRRLGMVKVLADGTFRQRFRVPEGLPAGGHTTQVNGIDARGEVRSFNLAIEVVNAPISPHQSVQATITSDPVDAMIAVPTGDTLRVDNSSAYVLLAALLIGGALFVLNGMRLKRRDLENLRRVQLRAQRRTTNQRSTVGATATATAGRDITGEIFIPR